MTAGADPKLLDVRLFDGALVLFQRISFGSMNAQIFRGTHAEHGDVVCKIIPIPPDESEAARCKQYFDDEVDCGRLLRSPYIRRMLDDAVFDTLPELQFPDGAFYLLFEWVPTTLDAILQKELPPPAQVLRLVHAVGAALQVAHDSLPPIVHRDLKPRNVLVVDSGDLGTAKLADFGIARMAGGTRVTSAHGWAGTELYMAPEQFDSSATVTPSVDIYALSLLVWQCLMGDVPLVANGTSKLREVRRNPNLPDLVVRERSCPELRKVLRWGLAGDPLGRPKSVEQLVLGIQQAGERDHLWGVAEAEQASAPPPGVPRQVPRVLVPPEQGSDDRASGGSLTLRLPPAAAGILERVTPNVEWTYSLTHRLWSTMAASVGIEQVTRILQAFTSREPLRVHEAPAKYSVSATEGAVRDDAEPSDGQPKAAPTSSSDEPSPPAYSTDGRSKPPRGDSRLGPIPLVRPSPALASIIGDQAMPRFEVANRIWAYVKEHGLQDPASPQHIMPDDKLQALFGGRSTVSTLEMTTVINRHLRDA